MNFVLETIGVPGSFFRGGQQFLSAKTQSCSAKKYPLRGAKFYNSVLPSWCTILFCHSVLPVLTLSKNDSKTGQNGKNRQIWQKPNKNGWKQTNFGRKIGKIWRKRGMLAMLCFCTFKLSNSFLPNCQFLFCQATQFCSAKLNIFAKGGPRPPRPPPKNAYACWLKTLMT